MRLRSDIFVSALLRRAQVEGAFAAILHRGNAEAGAVFVKVAWLDGTAALYGPAPQSLIEADDAGDRLFVEMIPPGRPEEEAGMRIAKEIRFDPDAYVVEIEDRQGRHFLDLARL